LSSAVVAKYLECECHATTRWIGTPLSTPRRTMIRNIRYNVGGDPKNDAPYLVPDNPPLGSIPGQFESPNRLLTAIPNDNTGAAPLYSQNPQKSFRIILPPLGQQGDWEAADPLIMPPEYGSDVEKVALHYSPVAQARPHFDGIYLRYPDGRRYVSRGVSGF